MQDYLRTETDIKLRGNPFKYHNSQKERPEDLNRCLHALLNRNVAQGFFRIETKVSSECQLMVDEQ